MNRYKVVSPVLFLIFNRPDETQSVFDEIRKAAPSRLYIASDGPRIDEKSDIELCNKALSILNEIDWDCEVKTLIRKNNLGCKNAVSSAITWFFENEQEGIILEDDCLPCSDFFKFCDEMLDYYRFDNQIAHIGGSNYIKRTNQIDSSYYFSSFTYVWGWATWRRVWKKYDVNLEKLNEAISADFLSFLTNSYLYKFSLKSTFIGVKNGDINTWDYQYLFLNIFNKQLSIVPNFNLISNIGFNSNATHTVSDSPFANVPFDKITFPIKHPKHKTANKNADNYTLKSILPSRFNLFKSIFKNWIKNFIKF